MIQDYEQKDILGDTGIDSHKECTSPTKILENPEKKLYPFNDMLEKLPELNEIFTIHGKIGEGTFSSVFVASLNNNNAPESISQRLFAIKHLVPTCHPSRVERELKCLQDIGGTQNVVGIDFCLRNHENVAFVMPFINHEKFNDYYMDMNAEETALYIKNILIALQRVHSFEVIHRDVKPNNFLYDRKNKQFLLVDFGLADFVKKEAVNCMKRKNCSEDKSQAKRAAVPTKNSPVKKPPPVFGFTNKENTPLYNNKVSSVNKSPFKSPFKNYNSISPKNSKPPISIPAIFQQTREASIVKRLTFNDEGRLGDTKPSIFSRNSTKNLFGLKAKVFPQQSARGKTELKRCDCFKKARVCNICMLKKVQYAPRAGTPGFRPPEVLLKYPHQTTAVDIWAVGIIFISILSGCYPFFKAPDDISALAEIITLFGTDNIHNLAKNLGQSLTCSNVCKAVNLKELCIALRNRFLRSKHKEVSLNGCKDCKRENVHPCFCFVKTCEIPNIFPDSAYDLLEKLLDVNPHSRITAEAALNHPFLINIH